MRAGPDVRPFGLSGLRIYELLAKAHGRDSVAVRNDAQEFNEDALGVADRLFHGVFVGPELPRVRFKDVGHRELARLDVVVFQRAVVVGFARLDVPESQYLSITSETGISSALATERMVDMPVDLSTSMT